MNYENCRLCPRKCGTDRTSSKLGFCKCPSSATVSRSALHFWEEPCISGKSGSGAVFFTGCNLNCVFCQNYKISQQHYGREITDKKLSELFLNLQAQGANNINLVSPTPYVPSIINAIAYAKLSGLNIPVVYNTNGYENTETLKELNGLIDIYLPDLKYVSDNMAVKYSNAKNYLQYASSAILEMYDQVGNLKLDEKGIAQRGIMIRHLILPASIDESRRVLDWIKSNLPDDVYVSLMGQYIPLYKAKEYKNINRRITKFEYNRVIDYFFSIGLKNGYIQKLDSASEKFIPDFDLTGI